MQMVIFWFGESFVATTATPSINCQSYIYELYMNPISEIYDFDRMTKGK
jgi:hypothetical protein